MSKGYRGMGMEGSVARWYAETTRKDLPEFARLARRLADELAPGGSVLEIAPGPGYLSVELARLGLQVTGIDISQTFVELARKNAAAAHVDAHFEHGDAAHLPFSSESFDFVVCRAAFKNFSDPAGALREMHRVLKPGGRGLIIDLRRDASMSDIAVYVEGLRLSPLSSIVTKLTFRLMLLRRAYSKEELEALLRGVPFARADVKTNAIGLEASFAVP
jgi:ubiquinone/menaquinone biosynthesis C-methylase UbiE